MKGRETRYWSNERKKNAKLKKDEVQCIEAKEGDEVQCIEACHRGWKRWSSLLAEMTRRPEPVGENRSRSSRSRSRDLCTTLNFKENGSSRDVETKRLPPVLVFLDTFERFDICMRDYQDAYKACNLNVKH